MPTRTKILSLSILLALPLATVALERTELLPPDAQTYVRISNTTNFWSKLKQSSLGRLWVDQQFQDFLGNPDAETWRELVFDGETDAEDDVFIEQMKMLQGEVILAFDTEMENPCIIAAMNREDFLRSLEMDEKLLGIAEDPFEILKSTFQGVEIIQHIEDGGTPDEESAWQAHLNNTFVLGYTKEWVEKCIVELQKEPVEEPEGNPVCNLNLPLSGLFRKLIEEENEKSAGNPAPLDTERLFNALGLMGVENYSLRIELKETEMVADSNLLVSDLAKGIFTILDVQPSELPTVGFIPENIALLEVGRFNLLRFWQEIPNIIATAMPSAKPQFDMILAMFQQQAGIDFEQDLLTHLGTQYLSFSIAEDERQVSTIAVELKDGPAFKTGLESILAAPALQPQLAAALETEEFLDHTIYTVKSGDPADAVAFGVAGDYLLYGQPDGLRQVIRSESGAAAAKTTFEQSPLVKGLRQHVPPRAFGYSAIDWKKNMDVLVRELDKPEYVAAMQQNWAKSGSPLPPPEFDKLPPVDHIASFFNVSFQYTEATADGLHQRIILKY